LLALFWSITLSRGIRAIEPSSNVSHVRQVRYPVAVACFDGGQRIVVANRRSGSVSVVDTAAQRVVAEYKIAQALADMALLPGSGHLIAADSGAGELLLLRFRDRSIEVISRVKVSPDPARLVVSNDGSLCVVASVWSRQLTFAGLAKANPNDAPLTLSMNGTLDLPFSPREIAMLSNGSKLVVAEAFGGRLAVVEVGRRAIESIRTLPGHNIRGLAFSRDQRTLLIAHQILPSLAHSSFDDVHWGLLVRNQLRVLQAEALLRPGSDAALLQGSRLFDLGDVGYAAGDPSALAFDVHGKLIVALAGVDEVAITPSPEQAPRRTVVGRRPTALATSPDGSVTYVADTLDDTISVVDIENGQRIGSISLGPRPELSATERGERLFYSAKLSHDGWMSCHSCHTDGHTNNLLSDTLGDGSYGAPKRVPSLLGVAKTGPWTWTGSIARLEDQIRKSIKTTMHGPEPTGEQVADLAEYLKSLAPPSPATTRIGQRDLHAVARGHRVFEVQKCATCHVPPEYTSPKNYDVGLVDEVGNRQFNPPSLRGVSQRDALLHDGHSRSLEDVFQKVRHPRDLMLSREQIADLAAFLGTL
jgi:YVTN family beta-propeller protein